MEKIVGKVKIPGERKPVVVRFSLDEATAIKDCEAHLFENVERKKLPRCIIILDYYHLEEEISSFEWLKMFTQSKITPYKSEEVSMKDILLAMKGYEEKKADWENQLNELINVSDLIVSFPEKTWAGIISDYKLEIEKIHNNMMEYVASFPQNIQKTQFLAPVNDCIKSFEFSLEMLEQVLESNLVETIKEGDVIETDLCKSDLYYILGVLNEEE